MPHLLISIGTNHQRIAALSMGMAALRRQAEVSAVSHWYVSAAVGSEAAPYWNAMMALDTPLMPDALKLVLSDVERQAGRVKRDAAGRKSRVVTLDLDIVAIDGVPAAPDLFTLAHMVVPLADIAPQHINPHSSKSAAYHAARLQEWVVRLPSWQGLGAPTPAVKA